MGREKLLSPAEVGELFGVDAKTVSRWARRGRLTSVHTLGGHRRFLQSEVRRLMAEAPVRKNGKKAMTTECPKCEATGGDVAGIEIIGVYDGVLFWQCLKDGERWHRWPEGHYLRARAENVMQRHAELDL